MPRQLRGDFALLFVTVVWGLTFPLIGNAVQEIDPTLFVMVRFFLAAFALLPFILLSTGLVFSKELIGAGLILGALNAVSYVTQTIGLKTISSAEAAFITGISVVIVPFILPLFAMAKPTRKDILCSLLCLQGLFILTLQNGAVHFSTGSLWVLCCSVTAAFTIAYIQKASMRIKAAASLAFYQILFTAVLLLPFNLKASYAPLSLPSVMIGIGFCSIIATSLVLWLQAKYQRYTTATRAAMIFCLEPIFASIFGYLINHEVVGYRVLIGGSLILSSILLSELHAYLRKTSML
jgi:drug/metabolite transporter (DMT)-like permease